MTHLCLSFRLLLPLPPLSATIADNCSRSCIYKKGTVRHNRRFPPICMSCHRIYGKPPHKGPSPTTIVSAPVYTHIPSQSPVATRIHSFESSDQPPHGHVYTSHSPPLTIIPYIPSYMPYTFGQSIHFHYSFPFSFLSFFSYALCVYTVIYPPSPAAYQHPPAIPIFFRLFLPVSSLCIYVYIPLPVSLCFPYSTSSISPTLAFTLRRYPCHPPVFVCFIGSRLKKNDSRRFLDNFII